MDIEILTADLDSAIRFAASDAKNAALVAAAAKNAEGMSHSTVDLLDIAADWAASAAKSWAEAAAAARALRAAVARCGGPACGG